MRLWPDGPTGSRYRGIATDTDAVLSDAPPLDVLHLPGGLGQEALMEDEEVPAWIRQQAGGACSIFSVCTGALKLGAAGLLMGRRATTQWDSCAAVLRCNSRQ